MLLEGERGLRFSRALFAEQCWRIISNEMSLVVKFSKARYFRNTIFLEVELVFYPSHFWRSLLWGRKVIRRGIIWHIRNRSSVQVYKDN